MKKKLPFVDLECAEKIIEKVPTPFHIYDEKGIIKNAKAVNKAFSWNKGFKEYYAVKACPNPYIIQILNKLGCGCDCSSLSELIIAKALGQTGHNTIFSSNDTPKGEFRFAADMGAIINFDDITMIDFYEKEVGSFPDTICLRYNPGGIFKVSNSIMDNPGEAKYGMTEEQMVKAVKTLMKKGVKNFGIHSFLVSNAVTNNYYPSLARELFNLALRIRKKTSCHFAFINLSGGIGIPYVPGQKAADIALIGENVRKAYEEILTPEGMDDVAIYTELGRYMTGPFGGLISRVIHEKHIAKDYIGLDACAVNLMRPAMYGAYHHITVLGKEDAPTEHVYDVTGSLCENNDKFAIDRDLPKIDIGDIVFIHDTGAHGFAMGYNYNGKLRSAEVLLKKDGSFEVIRRAETIADYFSTFDELPIYKDLHE